MTLSARSFVADIRIASYYELPSELADPAPLPELSADALGAESVEDEPKSKLGAGGARSSMKLSFMPWQTSGQLA
jgi:hypothetical protein